MSKTLPILFLAAILLETSCLNWQSAGNMSESNLTEIWSFINTKIRKDWTFSQIATGGSLFSDFSSNLSSHLNTLWASAWNVAMTYITDASNADTVVYGYAFRDHWMWYNGYQMDDGYYVGFIIWKDYNCAGWTTFNLNTDPTYNFADPVNDRIINAFNTFKTSGKSVQNNIWQTAKNLSETLEGMSDFSGGAFTVLLSESANAAFFGQFCINSFSMVTVFGDSPSWGAAMILHMRI